MYVVKRSSHNPILGPNKEHHFEAFAAFNMSVIKKGSTFYGFYRAMSALDKLRSPERISTIGIGKSKDGTHFGERLQFIAPKEEWEKFGCEDPRATYFEGKYYIFYTALSTYPFEASGIKVAVAISKDLKKVDERHLVTPFNAKAMALFPERINGKITVIVSVNTDMPPAKIAIAQMDSIEEMLSQKFWEKWYIDIDKHVIDLKRSPYDHVEVGASPLKTKKGWLVLYSHIQNYFGGSNLDRIFGIEAVVLDKSDPHQILGRTRGPLLVPAEAYEILGHVPNVVFPTGAIVEKDVLSFYYGAADMTVGKAAVNLSDLVETMLPGNDREFKRAQENPIIVPANNHPWESKATFNPAVLRIGNVTHILYRTLSDDNTSFIGYASSKDGVTIDERLPEPIYVPREDFESKKNPGGNSGCEDPRLTKIGDTIYMCYTAYDGVNPPRVAITTITLKDFLAKNWKWEKPVLITPPGFDEKDACIFPEKTGGHYFIMHRVDGVICGDYFKTLDFEMETVNKCINIIGPRINSWDSSKVGIAAPPIKTKKGWLLLYHGVSKSHNTYRVGAVLLDLEDPSIVLARTSDPIFEPRELYEKSGIVNNVVFPCGLAEKNGLLYIYYGGGDTVVGVATMELNIILKALTRDL